MEVVRRLGPQNFALRPNQPPWAAYIKGCLHWMREMAFEQVQALSGAMVVDEYYNGRCGRDWRCGVNQDMNQACRLNFS